MDRLLLIDDEADVQYSFRRIFDSPEIELTTASSGEEGLRLLGRIKPDLVIMDVRMGGMNGLETLRRLRQTDAKLPVIMMTAYGTTQTAIEAMKLGAYDYLLKPFDVPKLKQLVAAALKASRDMKQVVSYQPMLESEDYTLGIVGRSDGMQNVFKLIGQLAGSDATALITGESGTGKELVARAIYHHSRRSSQPFLAINCAAIPENLLESELFGHEKGAFTGAAAQRIGKFEQCDKGTIFLDEIGDMSLPTQTKILRVLQSGTFERVGGNQPIKVDVRTIAATNKPLEQAVTAKEFREDLFYRLNVVRVQIPALRERREDIRLLELFSEEIRGSAGPAAEIDFGGGGQCSGAAPLAGKRPRAGERGPAGDRRGQRRGHSVKRFAPGGAEHRSDGNGNNRRSGPGRRGRGRGAGGGGRPGGGGADPVSLGAAGGRTESDSRGGTAVDHRGPGGNQGQPGAGSQAAGNHPGHASQAGGKVPHPAGAFHQMTKKAPVQDGRLAGCELRSILAPLNRPVCSSRAVWRCPGDCRNRLRPSQAGRPGPSS